MPYCSVCGHHNPDDVGVCLNCAAVFGRNCLACGQPVPAGNKFCGQCGARLPEAVSRARRGEDQAPPVASIRQGDVLQDLRAMMPTALAEKINTAGTEVLGERREVTVVFVDVSNFTAASHGLDSEDAFMLIDEAMRLLVKVVYKYEGTVDKFTGDGLMALFGAPVAHENDPERAVRTALEMQTVLQPLRERVKQKHGFDFQARIGINTGLVVAGQVGSDLHMEYTVIGDTVNLASRLETAAEPGTVLVSFATYQRTRPLFRFKASPPLTVKGLPEPIQAFQALGLQEGSRGGRGLPGLQVPMIGRHDALARLENALDEVCWHHHSLIVLVTGRAGLGKSRLVTEFRKSLSQAHISVYQGSCLAYARSRPLWLVAELLRDILHLSEIDPAHVQRKTLQAYLDQLGLSNDEVLPYLTHLLGLPQTDPEIETRLRLLDASMLKRQTHAALRQVFLAEARLAPTVLIFEDLHWVDPASREFLEYLIQTTSDASLMLVLVSRDAERETVIRPLIAIAEKNPERLVDIQLQTLSEAEGRLLVDQLIKQTTQEARALKRRIAERAAGIPFYAEEIVRMLIDEGGLTGEDGTWQVTPRADELLGEVPGTLKGLILARFDRLPENLRRTLQKAAVLGDSFPVGLLEMLNGTSPETIAAQLSKLEARQFLTAERFGSEPGYAFHHTLIQEAVYGTLLKRDRRNLHEQAGQAIERGAYWLPEEQPEVLAYHYAESATPLKAVPFLIAAAQNADRRCANETAIQHYRQAMTLMQDQPTPGPGQAGYRDEFFRVRIGLARALKFVGEFAEASQLLLEVLQHLQDPTTDPGSFLPNIIDASRELADVRQREGAQDEAIAHLNTALEALGPAGAQEHPSLWRSLMDRMAWVRFRQGKLEEAFALASSATLGLDPEHADDPTTVASLYNTLGGVLWLQGNLSAAIAYVERSLNLHKALGYLWGMANAYTNLGVLHYALGNWPKAAENLEQAEALQQQIGDIQNRAITLNNLGTLRQSMGEHEAARRDLEASLSVRQRLGDTWGIAQSQVSLARLAVVQSRFEDAIVHVEAALALSEALGGYETEARWILALAQADRDLQTGLESARQALQTAKAAGLAEAEADCRRVLGVLQARAGEYREAEILLRESIDLCLQRNDPYRQGLALLELGRMCQRLVHAGHPDRAEWRAKALGTLEEAVAKFKSLGATYDLEMAQAALSQVQANMTAEASPRLPKGEWHTATIVWLSLSPPPGTDDEAFFETLSFVMPPLMTIAREQQGQVIRRQEGLAVVFGAPTAHEDDSKRAVHTARHMLKNLVGLSNQTEVPLTARLVVTQGDVIAGHIGHPSQPEFVVTGEPVLEAQRVAEAAPPGEVWVTQAVRNATDHLFIYESVPGNLSLSVLSIESVADDLDVCAAVWQTVCYRDR